MWQIVFDAGTTAIHILCMRSLQRCCNLVISTAGWHTYCTHRCRNIKTAQHTQHRLWAHAHSRINSETCAHKEKPTNNHIHQAGVFLTFNMKWGKKKFKKRHKGPIREKIMRQNQKVLLYSMQPGIIKIYNTMKETLNESEKQEIQI